MLIVKACVSQHKLLQQLRNGDAQTVSSFYKKLKQRVFIALAARYQSYQLQSLEDCFSDAFLLFLHKIKDEHFKAQNLEGYAYKIVHFYFRDKLRRKRWQVTTAPTEIPEPKPDVAVSFPNASALFEAQNSDQLIRWFHRLSAKEQQIFNLQVQNFKLKEIAEQLDLSYGTVRNTRSRLIKEARERV